MSTVLNLTEQQSTEKHNYIRDDTEDSLGHRKIRFTCINDGCDKKHVPSAVRTLSRVCKGSARLAARAARESASQQPQASAAVYV